MGEFQTKVESFKQTLQDPGFTTSDDGITDTPTIQGEDLDSKSHEEQDHSEEVHDQEPVRDSKPKRTRNKKVEVMRSHIDQLAHENALRTAQNQELLERVKRQEQLLSEKQQQLEQNEQHKEAYYETTLQTQEASILNALKVAKEEGDVDAEVKLSQALAQVTAQQATHNLYKSQLKNKNSFQPHTIDDDSDQSITYFPTHNITQDYDDVGTDDQGYDALEDWIERNPWANPESHSFSPRLRQEANEIATELEEMLKYNNVSHIIGTPEYFNSLDKIMSDRYGTHTSDTKKSSGNANYNFNVAPVSRSGSSMADQYISKNPNSTRQHMSLTPDEYKIARNLQIKLPNGRYATGDEAVRRYAEAKRASSVQTGSNKLIID
jgi:hypothetical protein